MGNGRVNRYAVGVGVIFTGIGVRMSVQGIAHTISGEPIPATTWTEGGSGPEQLVLGIVGIALGGFVIWKALRGGWPS